MYRKGELQVTVPPCKEMLADPNGECFSDKHKHRVYDSRDYETPSVGIAFLPRSNDEWVIGGKDQVKDLVDDLLEILVKMP